MKKILVLASLMTALLSLSVEASAQYVGQFERKGAKIIDKSGGRVLSDQEIISLVGEEIYEETFVGARRQMKSGSGLIIGGSAAIGAGAVFAVLAGIEMAKNDKNYDPHAPRYSYGRVPGLYLCSIALSSVGTLALGGGIALRAIGKGRIGWVTEQCNKPSGPVATIQWSVTPSGAGLVLRF